MKFPQDKNGKLDVSDGPYSREKVTLTKCKYTDEVRLCLGVAVVYTAIDGDEQSQEGRKNKVKTFCLFREDVTQHDGL